MKRSRFLSLAGIIVLAGGCASSGPPAEQADKEVLTAREIEAQLAVPIEVMLQRKFPGVRAIQRSDGGITLQIRGAATLRGEPKPPLVIVNGIERDPGTSGINSLVSAHDIESIRVLRGANAAIYGIRGADGVVVITVKGTGRH